MDFWIASALILVLLAISPAAASVSSLHSEPLEEIGQNIDIAYMFGGIGAAVLLAFIYTRLNTRMFREENKFTTNLRKTLYSLKIRNVTGIDEPVKEKAVQEEITTRQLRLYIAVPIMCMAIAELFIFSGKTVIAVWIHSGVLLALTLSSIFIKDPKVHKIYMPLMLLPVLRLVNLSMPVFSKITLYAFILYYIPLVFPVLAIIIHQRISLEQIGIAKKHFLIYMVLAVPLSFLLGLGEYIIIRPGCLIPNLSFENLLVLTIIMVFFVGLVEELIFRSILQTRIEQVLSAPESLLITSFLFGFMHSGYGTYYEMFYTGFVGLVLGFIFYKTKSLPFIVVVHGFVNVFLFGILPYYFIGRM